MGQDDQNSKSPLPIASLVALASMTIGLFLYQSVLKSDRPGDIQIGKSAMVGQQVLARLWEDPFEAVARHEEQEASGANRRTHRHSLETLQEEINERRRPIIALAVIVDSNPYAEGKEQRLRLRYAVLSALGESGFVPADGGHIEYFTSAVNTNVPFEWYEASTLKKTKASQSDQAILILWLPDDWTYRRTDEIPCRGRSDGQGCFFHDVSTLLHDLQSSRGGSISPITLRILGPSGSGMLHDWITEAKRLTDPHAVGAEPVHNLLKGTAIYSYSATADPAVLYSDNEVPTQDMNGEAKIFEHLGIHFERTISTDHDLAKALVEELRERGVNLSAQEIGEDTHDHIALIAEWDTFYGRALPLTFEATVQERSTGVRFSDAVKNLGTHVKWQNDGSASAEERRKWIHSYVYLQGLDGVTSEKGATVSGAVPVQGMKDANKSLDDEARRRFDTAYLERAEGPSQFDYIRRLTLSIERDQERLKRDGKRFRAIGILGSDVYDKLLILQALRKTFSNVIFFTTDLDARLFHPDEFEWSRNLVVASAYGLELNSYWQEETPPFRSSYQTALFWSTIKALDVVPPAPDRAAVPHLYEIGRRGPVELPSGTIFEVAQNVLDHGGWLFAQPDSTKPPEMVHPFPSPAIGKPVIILRALLASSILSCMIVLIYQRYWMGVRRVTVWQMLRCVMVFMTISLLLYIFVHVQLEPFSIFDGVSIWPTELLRIFVMLLSVLLLIRAKDSLENGDGEVARLFHLTADRQEPQGLGIPRWWWMSGTRPGIFSKSPDEMKRHEEPSSVDMIALWQEYHGKTQWRSRCVRITSLMVPALVLAVVTISLFDAPFVPYRGTVARWFDLGILVIAGLMTNALLFFMLDASLLAAGTIRRCIEAMPMWPRAALERSAQTQASTETDRQALLTIRFIGMLTGHVGTLIYYPFIVVALLMLARSRYFDNWDFPMGLLMVFGMNLTYAVAGAFVLRAVAEQARQAAVERVRDQHIDVKDDKERAPDEAKQIQNTIDEINKNQEGAFASFLYQPAFGASLIPTSGITLLAILEYFIPGR